jgi:hypothetical protein
MNTLALNTLAFRRPSAIAPIAMSIAALALVLVNIAAFGLPALRQETDEGAAAHIFQLLMAGQMPVIAWHAIRWLWRAPLTGLLVLGAQIAAALAAVAPVCLLGL